MAPESETTRVRLGDGAATRVHVVRHPLASTRVSVVRLDPETPLPE